jgi:hypothetical protein
MKNTKYFWKEVPLKADIERHRTQEKEIQDKIDLLESITEPTTIQLRALAAYRHFMYQLQLSKAEVVSKIGKK